MHLYNKYSDRHAGGDYVDMDETASKDYCLPSVLFGEITGLLSSQMDLLKVQNISNKDLQSPNI